MDVEKLRSIVGEGFKEHRVRLLMRNVLSTAYNAGYRQQALGDKSKPLCLYETRGDGLVRPSHRRWDRLLLLLKGSELAGRIWPPNGHNCRCVMRAISRKDAKALIENGQAHTDVPELIECSYIDAATGETMTTLDGVDPGCEGQPEDSGKRLAALIERNIEMASPAL